MLMCRSLGCLDPQCALCEHNPHRRCNVNFAPKYLVNDTLKAKCEAPIRVEVIDRSTGVPLGEDVTDIHLEVWKLFVLFWSCLPLHVPICPAWLCYWTRSALPLTCECWSYMWSQLVLALREHQYLQKLTSWFWATDVHPGWQCIWCKVSGSWAREGERFRCLLAVCQQ